MFTLEQKVDLIMRYIASSDMREVAKLKKAVAKALVDDEPTIATKTDTNRSVEQLATEFVKNAGIPPAPARIQIRSPCYSALCRGS